MSNKAAYIPSLARLIEVLDGMSLSEDDRYHLCRVKNWLREKQERQTVVSAHKVNPPVSKTQARGIAI